MSTMMEWRSEKEARTGEYRGVAFEIVRWRHLKSDGTPSDHDPRIIPEWTWNYYLHLPVDMLPEQLREEFDTPAEVLFGGRRKYHPAPDIIRDLAWHGGLTFWEKSTDDNGAPTQYQAGCDYAHGFDIDQHYTVDAVAADVRRTIDHLWRAIPDMRLRCSYSGAYVAKDDGFRTRRGNWMSFEGARREADWSMNRTCS